MSDSKELRDQAERYRRLMRDITDRRTLETLKTLAAECDAKAEGVEKAEITQAQQEQPKGE